MRLQGEARRYYIYLWLNKYMDGLEFKLNEITVSELLLFKNINIDYKTKTVRIPFKENEKITIILRELALRDIEMI